MILNKGDFSSIFWESHSFSEWDSFVEEHPFGTVWHLSEWRNHLQSFFKHIHGGFLVIRDPETGKIRAGLPVYEANSLLFGTRIISVPFATFCDPLQYSNEDLKLLLSALTFLTQDKGSKHAEVRALWTESSCWGKDYRIHYRFKHHNLILGCEVEKLRKNFSKKAVVQKILKAERSNIYVRKNEEDFDLFVNILAQGRHRLGLLPMPHSYFQSLRHHVSEKHRSFLVAFCGNEPMGALLVFKCGKKHIIESMAEIESARNLGVNQLLFWRAIQEACAEGAEMMSFGRTDLENTGLSAYKRRWGTIEQDLEIRIMSLQKKNDNTSPYQIKSEYAKHIRRFVKSCPMPLLRFFSRLVFNHWA